MRTETVPVIFEYPPGVMRATAVGLSVPPEPRGFWPSLKKIWNTGMDEISKNAVMPEPKTIDQIKGLRYVPPKEQELRMKALEYENKVARDDASRFPRIRRLFRRVPSDYSWETLHERIDDLMGALDGSDDRDQSNPQEHGWNQKKTTADPGESSNTENRGTGGAEPRYEYQGRGDEQGQADAEVERVLFDDSKRNRPGDQINTYQELTVDVASSGEEVPKIESVCTMIDLIRFVSEY